MVSNLTIITPVTNMAGRLNLLESWVVDALSMGIKVVLIHDYRDECTQVELDHLVKRCGTEELTLMSGRFGNPGAARNAGMCLLQTEWVCFWDSDDSPNLSNVLKEINLCHPGTDLVIGQYSVVDKSGKIDPYWVSTTYNLEDFALNPGLWRVLIRTRLMQQISFPSLRMGEDQVFLSRLNIESLKVRYSNQVLYRYYTGESTQLTSNLAVMKDLTKSIQILSNSIKLKSNENILVMGIMLIRMCITALIKGRFTSKLKSVIPLLQAVKRLGIRASLRVISRIIKVY